MVWVQVGKEFPNMRQDERRIVYESRVECGCQHSRLAFCSPTVNRGS